MTFFAGWLIIGLAGAVVARLALVRQTNRVLGNRPPITRGGLILLLAAAILGPATVIAASIWWLCEIAEPCCGWLGQPLFKKRAPRGAGRE